MICKRCNTQNEAGAKFCKNCGMELNFIHSNKDKHSKISDTLLTIFIFITFVFTVANFTIQKLVDDWYEVPTKYFQGTLWILGNLIYILVPIAIKNQTIKIIGIILTAIMVLYWSYGNFTWIFE